MVRCLFTRDGHCRWATSRGEVGSAAMWICFGCSGWNTFASNRNKHGGVVGLIAHGAGFAILDPKIGPILIDSECERRTGDYDVTLEIFCDVKNRFLFAQ